MLSVTVIEEAYNRIKGYLHRTPILYSTFLNHLLGSNIFFKAEALQKVGSFKVRGALNTLLALNEQGDLPKQVVAFSSGNHAQAVAWAAKILDIESTIYMSPNSSLLKRQATKSYGANVMVASSRIEAEERAKEYTDKNAYFIHPSNNDYIIAGAGTACFEALQDIPTNIDAIFAPCGGGGLLSGTYLAVQKLAPGVNVYGAEPIEANDASKSLKLGNIIKFQDEPSTIADGARTLAVSDKTFEYLKNLSGIYEITEPEIIYWTCWLMHLLKVMCEPTSALSMAAAVHWLKTQKPGKNLLVILSGGNIDHYTFNNLWKQNYLDILPNLDIDQIINKDAL
ncbi:L-threonine dehydratase catabolic TdcB [Rickettsiales bacterium Ac37b]|nr:L-threonine dehydratase catabolic TdcB [Rickettsiales bacterium Ac37b]